MEIHPLLIQFAGSMVAILALYGLARLLKLGGKPTLNDEAGVQSAATEVEFGFELARFSIARGGSAALAKDDGGRIMLLKRHGNRFAGRLLTSDAKVREEVDRIVINTGEARFGEVRLSLPDGSSWADAINRL